MDFHVVNFSDNGMVDSRNGERKFKLEITDILNEFIDSGAEYIGFVINSEKIEGLQPLYQINYWSSLRPFIFATFGGSDSSIRHVNNTPPVANIKSPSREDYFYEGDEITFIGTGRDREEGELEKESLLWVSSIDGIIGNGTSFKRSDLSPGIHAIKLIVKDREGEGDISTTYIIIMVKSDH